jgi:hypothetical protein
MNDTQQSLSGADLSTAQQWTEHASYRPDLLPPLDLMRKEHVEADLTDLLYQVEC